MKQEEIKYYAEVQIVKNNSRKEKGNDKNSKKKYLYSFNISIIDNDCNNTSAEDTGSQKSLLC